MPTMMRNAKNTGATGGRSSAETDLSPATTPSVEWVR